MREYEVLIQAGFEGTRTLCFKQIKHTSSVAWTNMYYDILWSFKFFWRGAWLHKCIAVSHICLIIWKIYRNLLSFSFKRSAVSRGECWWHQHRTSSEQLQQDRLKPGPLLASIPKVLIPHWLLLKVSELHHLANLATLMARNSNSYK